MKKILLLILGLQAVGVAPTLLSQSLGPLRNWKVDGATDNWQTAGNWNEGVVPNGADQSAQLTSNLTANEIITLTGDVSLGRLVIGDGDGSHAYTIGATAGANTFNFDVGTVTNGIITKNGGATDVLNAVANFLDRFNLEINAGTLRFAGGMRTNSTTYLRKTGGGNLTVGGNALTAIGSQFEMTNGNYVIEGAYNTIGGATGGSIFQTGGTTTIRGANTIFHGDAATTQGIVLQGGTINIGNIGADTNTFFANKITQTGNTTLNIGIPSGTNDLGDTHVAFYANNLTKNTGTLRLQYGNGNGVTRVLGGQSIQTTAGTLASGATSFTSTAAPTGVYVGMRILGPGIQPDTYVTSVSGNTIGLSKPVTSGFTQSNVPVMFAEGVHNGLSANGASTGNSLKLNSVANLNVGDTVTGAGIGHGVKITGIDAATNTVTFNTGVNVNVATGATIRTYRPGTLTFGGDTAGTVGATVEWLRGTSSQGTSRGSVLFDPSLRLELKGRAFVNISDNFSDAATGNEIQNFVFDSIHSSANTTNNTFQNVQTVAGNRWVWFANGQTALATGSIVYHPNLPGGQATVISVQGNSALLDKPASSTGIAAANVTQYTTIRSEAGGATLTVGNYGAVNDVFDGRLDFGSSAEASRLIKVGTNTLTLSGLQDNPSSRVDVQGGTVILGKTSTNYVHAIGSQLIIGDASTTARETARIGGTFSIQGLDLATYAGGRWANLNDQIYRSALVDIRQSGFLDLNGFTEGIGRLRTPGITVTSGVAPPVAVLNGQGHVGNSSSTTATLIVGEGSDNSDHFFGQMIDGTPENQTPAGGGKLNYLKTGGGTHFLHNNNTYTGTTTITRGAVDLRNNLGALSGTNLVRVANSTLILRNGVNEGGVNSNRINDNATVVLRQGTLTVTNASTAGVNINERIGDLVVDRGHSILRTQHDQGQTVNRVTIALNSYSRKAGSQISIVENDGDDNNLERVGFGSRYEGGWMYYGNDGINTPADAYSQVTVANMPTQFMIGGGGSASPKNNTNVSILLGAFGGHIRNQTREFMTIETVGGVNYIRPLTINEYRQLTDSADQSVSNTAFYNSVARHDRANTIIRANMASNSLRFAGATRLVIEDDNVIKVGDGQSNLGFNPAGHQGAGMVNFIDWGGSMYGGYLDFGTREAIFRVNGQTTLQTSIVGNNNVLNDGDGYFGLIKSGGNNLYLVGNNKYIGQTYVVQAALRISNSHALGANGVGNEVRLVTGGYDGDTLSMEGGVVLGSTKNASQRKDFILEYDARLSAFDQNNTVNGDIRVSSATEDGQPITSYLRTRRHTAMMTINGAVYGDSIFNPISPVFHATGGRTIGFIGDSMNDGIINIRTLADKKLANGQLSAGQFDFEKLNILIRGSTGDSGRAAPIVDFHVNVDDASNLTGQVDLRSGFLRVLGNHSTAWNNGTQQSNYMSNMVMRLRDTGNDYVNQVAVYSMSNNNADPWANPITYNVGLMQWGDGDNGYSASSYGMLANEGRGKVIIGDGYGSLDMNPTEDLAFGATFNFLYRNPTISNDTPIDENGNPLPPPTTPPPLTSVSGTTISFGNGGFFAEGSSIGDLAVGMIVQGPALTGANPVRITAINGNNVTFSESITINPGDSISFSSPQSFTYTGATRNNTLQNVVEFGPGGWQAGFDSGNLRPGMLLTGSTGVPANTYILQVIPPGGSYPNGAIILNNALTAATTNLTFNDSTSNANTTQRYADARMYAAEGGELELRLRLLDDGGFSLDNEVGAITKVGRGAVRLSGAKGLSGELDGGVNLHGGTLILDYTVNSGRKITSGDNQQAPLTLGGGDLWMIGNGTSPDPLNPSAVNSIEQLRGVMVMRPGASMIRVQSGGQAETRLDLGVPSNLANNLSMLPARYAGSSISFWRDNSGGGDAVITFEVPTIYTGDVLLPWAVWHDPETGKVIDFASVTGGSNPSDLLFINSAITNTATSQWSALNYLGTNNPFGYSSIDNRYLPDGNTDYKYGYLSEYVGEAFGGEGQGYHGVIQAGRHLRTITFNVQNQQGSYRDPVDNVPTPNGVINLQGTMILLSDQQGAHQGGAAGTLGGAILVSNLVGSSHKEIRGGALSSAMETYYFDGDATHKLQKAYDLVVHNYADPFDFANPNSSGGLFTIQSDIVNPGSYTPLTPGEVPSFAGANNAPLNFVHGGTGTTRMIRASSAYDGYHYTGSTFFNGGATWVKSNPASNNYDTKINTPGTVWVSDPNKLGTTPVAFDADNFYFTGGRLLIANMTDLNQVVNGEFVYNSNVIHDISNSTITLAATRGITIGGNGAYLNVAHQGTTFVINSRISVEQHAPTFAGGQIRQSNLGIGDLTKEGLGTLVISNVTNTYSGVTEVKEGTLVAKIGDANSTTANFDPIAYRAADNADKNIAGTLGSSFSYIDGTTVNQGAALRFEITGNQNDDIYGRRYQNGTGEWITMDGGTLGTTAAHLGGALQGMIRVRKDSIVDIVGNGVLRFNSKAGMLTSEGAQPGQGSLTKIGTGTLELWENNSDFKGNWVVKNGKVAGLTQGRPLGVGDLITLGDSNWTAATGEAGVFLGSRTERTFTINRVRTANTTSASNATLTILDGDATGLLPGMYIRVGTQNLRIAHIENATSIRVTGNYPAGAVYEGIATVGHTAEIPLEYNIEQNILVKAEANGAAEQIKRIGARNHDMVKNSGMNWDRYNFDGNITLEDSLRVSYYDDVANTGIGYTNATFNNAGVVVSPLIGRDQVIALNGNIIATANNDLITEIIYNGDTSAIAQALNKRLRIYFEINGANNSQWNSKLIMGNGATSDLDKTHIVRLGGTGTPITAATSVHMTSNSIFQVGGKNVAIGNLMVDVAGVAVGTGANTGTQQIIVENASDVGQGTLRINQSVNEDWDVQFRNGTTDSHYITNVNNTLAGDGNGAAGYRDRLLNIVKDGSATAVLTQDNNYTGTTTVDNGRLQVGKGGGVGARAAGDTGVGGLNQGATIVNSLGRLGGTGTVQGNAGVTTHRVTGVIEPGDYAANGTSSTIGTLAVVGNLDIRGGTFSLQAGASSNTTLDSTVAAFRDFNNTTLAGQYNTYVNSTADTWEGLSTGTSRQNHDLLTISGSITIDSSSKFVFSGEGITFAAGQVFDLVDWTTSGSMVGNFNFAGVNQFGTAMLYQGGNTGSFELPTLTNNLLWDLQKLQSHGILIVTSGIAVVPEPGRVMLLLMGAVMLLQRRRRKM